jgi:Uma2 family endonuclease
VQDPLILNKTSAPQPDLMVLRMRADRYFSAHPHANDALLVVEVADTTLAYDLSIKLPLYASAGVVEMWIVDIEPRAIHVFREPREGRYEVCLRAAGDDTVTVDSIGREVRVADLFPVELHT